MSLVPDDEGGAVASARPGRQSWRYISKAVVTGGLLVFGLHVPTLSTVAIVLLGLVALNGVLRQGRISRRLVSRLAILTLALASYYLGAANVGPSGLADAIKYTFFCLSAYALGFWLSRREGRVPLPEILAVVTGLILFVTICVWGAPGNAVELERAAGSYWRSGEVINAPALGVMTSLGMALGAAAVFGLPAFRRKAVSSWIFIAVLSAPATAANVMLQNRGPFVAAVMAGGAVAAYISWRTPRSGRRLGVLMLLGTALMGAGLAAALLDFKELQSLGIYGRFASQGVETPRYVTWGKVLLGMWSHPMGGRAVDISPVAFAHNLWLDAAWESGLPPFLALVAFHAGHGPAIRRVLRDSVAPDVGVWILALLVSFLVGFMSEPVLAGDMYYFASSCLLLGAIMGADTARSRGLGSSRGTGYGSFRIREPRSHGSGAGTP